MQIRMMVTDGGPHPAWKHAMITADKLVTFSPDAKPSQAIQDAAYLLKKQIEAMLIADHEWVEAKEKEAFVEHSHARLNHLYGADPEHVAVLIERIVALTKGTVLEHHFANPDVQAVMEDVLQHEFSTQQSVHRSWHADAHPDTEHAKQFRANPPLCAHTLNFPDTAETI